MAEWVLDTAASQAVLFTLSAGQCGLQSAAAVGVLSIVYERVSVRVGSGGAAGRRLQ